MVERIIHQDHVCAERLRSEGADAREKPGAIEVGKDVAVDHQKRFIAHERKRLGNAAGGLQRLRLGRVDDAQAEAATVA